MIEQTHELNSIKKVIGVVSGKGGVGKSLVTSTLAVLMRRKGYNVGILDADITGPSIPKMFGITKKAEGNELGLFPQKTSNDISVMSVNLLLEKDDSPVIWRGPIIAGTVKQFWTDVIWGNIDYMFIDMPPGTGDVPLTVYQSIPLDGIIIVTSPQDLVSLIVKKAFNMAKSMNIPIMGIVENMSYLKCPDCGKNIKLFGDSKIDDIAEKLGIKVLGKMPIDTAVAELCDNGEIEKLNNDYLMNTTLYIEENMSINEKENDIMKIAIPNNGKEINQHFGKSTSFVIASVEGEKVLDTEEISTAELTHQHEGLANLLINKGVKVIIAGGIGAGALSALEANGMNIVKGASGNYNDALIQYLNGTLKSNENAVCSHHHEHNHNH